MIKLMLYIKEFAKPLAITDISKTLFNKLVIHVQIMDAQPV